MSVYSRIFIGPTLEIATRLSYADFRKCDAFIEKHPELDEYAYNLSQDAVGKLVLIVDGMNGHYARLVYIDKCTYNAHQSHTSQVTELSMPQIDDELLKRMKALYEEYTGQEMKDGQIKYAIWTQWY